MNRPIVQVAFASLLFALIAPLAWAEGNCYCQHCGCCCPCQKTCRIVEEEKKVEIICWGKKCEDFCVPSVSERGCKHCEIVCETCGGKGSEDICSNPTRRVWYDWFPGCGAQIYTKHKLMRGVTTKKVPSFKWVVEDLCPDCVAKAEAAQVTPGIEVPEPPQVAANVRTIFPAPAAQ